MFACFLRGIVQTSFEVLKHCIKERCRTVDILNIFLYSIPTQLSRFLRSMCELGVVKVEETGKGVESITDVNFNHDLVTRFSPSLLPTNTGHSASALAQGGSSKKKVICIQICHFVDFQFW